MAIDPDSSTTRTMSAARVRLEGEMEKERVVCPIARTSPPDTHLESKGTEEGDHIHVRTCTHTYMYT